GCDLECGQVYAALGDAIEQGLIAETEIDRALSRLMAARFRLGMFDPPEQVAFNRLPEDLLGCRRHQELALRAARESIVLLKNENNLLPLPKAIRSVAVIGPNADDAVVLLGNYNGTPASAVTPLQGIQRKVAATTQIHYAPGCGLAEGLAPLVVIPAAFLRPTR